MAYPSTLIPANTRRICSFSYGRGCRAPITVSREIPTTVLCPRRPRTVQTAAHGRVGLRRAHAAGRGRNEQLLVAASRASFTSTEPPSPSRNHLLAVPSKRWPKICSSLLSHHVASVDVTNLKAYVLIKMKDASSLHSCYHTYLSLARC